MDYIITMKEETGHQGDIDIVCHSTGACIARYMLEVIDGKARNIKVRQLIGLGPANNGSSMAELFNDPELGEETIGQLSGVFVPRRFDPSNDLIVQEMRPKSCTTVELLSAGIRDDITYRSILSANKTKNPEFFPCFEGKTWNLSPDRLWETTYDGDGVVSHCDSRLPGSGFDILPADPSFLDGNPEDYCHIRLPRNKEVINRVIEYLIDPDTTPSSYW